MSAVGELLQAHCLEGLSPLVGGCEQEYNLAVLCHPLEAPPLHCPEWAHLCISHWQYSWLFPANSLLMKPVADTELDCLRTWVQPLISVATEINAKKCKSLSNTDEHTVCQLCLGCGDPVSSLGIYMPKLESLGCFAVCKNCSWDLWTEKRAINSKGEETSLLCQ